MAPAPTHQPTTSAARATHVLALASPTPDLLQFAREALWVAQERDLPLTLAVRTTGRLQSEVRGLDTIDDLATFAERWNITLVPWHSRQDLEAMIAGWTVRPPAAVLVAAPPEACASSWLAGGRDRARRTGRAADGDRGDVRSQPRGRYQPLAGPCVAR